MAITTSEGNFQTQRDLDLFHYRRDIQRLKSDKEVLYALIAELAAELEAAKRSMAVLRGECGV